VLLPDASQSGCRLASLPFETRNQICPELKEVRFIDFRFICYSTMHHSRKFFNYVLETGEIETNNEGTESFLQEKTAASASFVFALRQLVLRKVAELQAQVVPLLKGTKLRIENYIGIELSEGEDIRQHLLKRKQELIAVYLEKLTIIRISEEAAIDYVQVMVGSVQIICGGLVGLKPFTTTFCILELYHQLISCLYGNEKCSKSQLTKRRGFGLHEEYFGTDVALSALGLKLSFQFLGKFCTFVAGSQRRQHFSLILACLYYHELSGLSEEVASIEFKNKISKLIQSELQGLSDERTLEPEYCAISLKQFLAVYCRKYRRNQLKIHAAQVFYEVYVDSKELQNELCHINTELYLVYGGQFYVFSSSNMNSALTAIKIWLKPMHFEELAIAWYQFAIKKVTVSENDQMGLTTIEALISLACRDIQTSYGINIVLAFRDPDTVARLFLAKVQLVFSPCKLNDYIRINEAFSDERDYRKFIGLVGVNYVCNGKIPKVFRRKTEEISKVLPYQLKCGNLLQSTGIFLSSINLKKFVDRFPLRFDINGVLPVEDREAVDVNLYHCQESKSAMRPLLRTKILLRLHQKRAQDEQVCRNLAPKSHLNDYMSRSQREPRKFTDGFIANAGFGLPINQGSEMFDKAHDSFSKGQESNRGQGLKHELNSLHDSCEESEDQETELDEAEANACTLLVQDDRRNEELVMNSVMDGSTELPKTSILMDPATPIRTKDAAVAGKKFDYKTLSLKLQQKIGILIN
jgi:hypothetical protein